MSAFVGPTSWWTTDTDDGRTHIAKKGVSQTGLVLNVDSHSLESYPGTGTTWYNLASNLNDGTLSNAPSFDGTAFTFSGTNIIDFGSDSSLDLTTNLTIESWIYPTGYGGGTLGRIFDRQGTPTGIGYLLFLENSSSGLRYAVNGAAAGGVDSAPNAITLNTWQHVAVTQSGSTVKFYVNGSLFYTSLVNFQTPTGGTTPAYIGNRLDGARTFAGKISIVRVYNRTLTNAELERNFDLVRNRFGV